jgi:hypothetical protein
MNLLAIDPGTTESAYVGWDTEAQVLSFGKRENEYVRWVLPQLEAPRYTAVVIEQVESFGMPVGREVFETVHFAGRLFERFTASGFTVHRMPRRAVKLHLCGTSRAKDSNVRCALIDRFGGKQAAIGTKASPGPLYGISGDVWQALALAVTFADTQRRAG